MTQESTFTVLETICTAVFLLGVLIGPMIYVTIKGRYRSKPTEQRPGAPYDQDLESPWQ